jgi:hypothetical protein
MSSKATRTLLVLAFALAACSVDDDNVIDVSAQALTETEVGPPTRDPIDDDAVDYRWELALRPDSSNLVLPMGGSTIRFVPDKRGVYVLQRWIEYGLSERLTHRFVVMAHGKRPVAKIAVPASATIGTVATLDASASESAEGLSLTYHWRLVKRPSGSNASMSAQGAMANLMFDAPGEFVIEVAVFDGQLWSESSASATIVVE